MTTRHEKWWKTTNIVRRDMQDHQKESNRRHQEIQPRNHTRNDHYIKEPEESPKNAKASRQTNHTPRQGREIHDQGKIIVRIEEFYTELYDSELSTITHTDAKEVPEITSWEVEAALRDVTKGTTKGHGHISIDTLKAGAYTISKTLAKLYTNC